MSMYRVQADYIYEGERSSYVTWLEGSAEYAAYTVRSLVRSWLPDAEITSVAVTECSD